MLLLCVLFAVSCHAATPNKHGWDTVSEFMGMHGSYGGDTTASAIPQEDIDFVAKNYATITAGASCHAATINRTHTMEADILALSRRIKAVNPDAIVGQYWRSDFALELSICSDFTEEWEAHPEYRLKLDNGSFAGDHGKGDHFYIDYTNPLASAFFAKVIVSVTKPKLSSNGKPVLDYVYLDGDPGCPATHKCSFMAGINDDRSRKLVSAYYACFGDIQRQLDSAGLDQKIILNGLDDKVGADSHVASGVAGSMFDHWSILQFLDIKTGAFNVKGMQDAIALVTSAQLSNITLKIKGWPGPIVQQKDHYPPSIPTPQTPAEFQKVAADRFNSELALFLIVATENDFWVYSWFWRWYDYVPGNNLSTVPPGFFPEAKCALGKPLGPLAHTKGSLTYTRKFEHASVFVDLEHRQKSRVVFAKC